MTALQYVKNVRQERANSKMLDCKGANTKHGVCSLGIRENGMYYCFLQEDIESLDRRDPLQIQINYANRIGRLCIGSLSSGYCFDSTGKMINLEGQSVLLRSSYDNMSNGIDLIESLGAIPLETKEDIAYIEKWCSLNLTRRKIIETEISLILDKRCNDEITSFVDSTNNIFVKSRNKGFSAQITTKRFQGYDVEMVEFWQRMRRQYGNKILLSEFLPLREDSLGMRESRHIVINNKILSSSRMIHSLKHIVVKSHIKKACEIVERLRKEAFFPANYVLDVGEFKDGLEQYVDVIEINPLSSSMCFVNNSIYCTYVPEIAFLKQKLNMGAEYCFDYLNNPQSYYMLKASNIDYSYQSDERYVFLEKA